MASVRIIPLKNHLRWFLPKSDHPAERRVDPRRR